LVERICPICEESSEKSQFLGDISLYEAIQYSGTVERDFPCVRDIGWGRKSGLKAIAAIAETIREFSKVLMQPAQVTYILSHFQDSMNKLP
jgi:hypothetical protein